MSTCESRSILKRLWVVWKGKNWEEADHGGLNEIGHIREGLVQVGRIVWEWLTGGMAL